MPLGRPAPANPGRVSSTIRPAGQHVHEAVLLMSMNSAAAPTPTSVWVAQPPAPSFCRISRSSPMVRGQQQARPSLGRPAGQPLNPDGKAQ